MQVFQDVIARYCFVQSAFYDYVIKAPIMSLIVLIFEGIVHSAWKLD